MKIFLSRTAQIIISSTILSFAYMETYKNPAGLFLSELSTAPIPRTNEANTKWFPVPQSGTM